MHEPFLIPDGRVEGITRVGPASFELAVQATQPQASCPTCLTPSKAVHSWYRRRPADLPSLGHQVFLNLSVRRLFCRNRGCPRQTFAEPLPALLVPRARRTRRLATAQGRVGVACGGEAGARLLHHLSMPTSADTVLRLVRALPLPESERPRAVGVDDWALKKGQLYGTILVDLDDRRVIDLLPDRTAPTLAHWLQSRPTIEVIARDRSSEYARGATRGAPHAVQVADRWHLLYNLRQMLARWLAGIQGRLQRLPPVPDQGSPGRRTQAFPRTRVEAAATAASRARGVALYEEVRRRVAAGEKLLAISRAMGLARSTVRRYAYAEGFPERAVRVPPPSILDPYLKHLEARLAEGAENATALWRELQALGFSGTPKQVHRWVNPRRTAPAKSTPRPWRATHAQGPAPALPSPKQLAWLLVQAPEELDQSETATLARIGQDADIARVVGLSRRFVELVRRCGVGSDQGLVDPLGVLASWFEEACACGIRALETFAAGLQQDEGAIRAALTTSYSSAQTEGQITKLKLVKRQMYGRAHFDLLRRRVLLAA